MTNYLDMDINKIHDLLVKKEIKPIDLVNEALKLLEDNKDLNAMITICKEEAIKRAKELEGNIKDNLLYGIPIVLKDNISTKGIKTTAGSKMLDNYIPVFNAHVTDLVEETGMIVIGKTNMDEFAFGSSTGTSYYGPCKNPWNKTLVPGGSSGGSASIVAAGFPFALGSDTGGSIRQPSSFCGVVGLKPTYGRISRYGLIAFASSLDQIGPITRNVYNNALLLNILCKKDERDLTNIAKEEDFTRLIGKDIKGTRIAIPKFYVNDKIDKQIIDKFNETVELLKKNGCTIDIVDVKYIDYAVPLYQIIALGEASSNLARFDGLKYGYSTKENVKDIYDFYKKTRSEAFGDEAKRRIMIGSYLLSGKNAKEYYEKAQKIRKSIKDEFDRIFSSYDVVIGPTTTTLPYKVGESLDDAVKSFMDDILTIPVNMAGLPGMSLPIGLSKERLPIGMQIIANSFDEANIYKLASFIEKEISFNNTIGGDK